MKWDVKALERGLKLVSGRVAVSGGTPSVADGDGFSVEDVAAGKVRVRLADPGKSILVALANSNETTDADGYYIKFEIEDYRDVVFRVYDESGALVDNVGFGFVIVAKDARL